MTNEQFALLNKLVLLPLKNQGAQVFIFGSRAVGKHHPHSDVDLMYKGDVPALVLSNIKEAIEESMFPFAVDLVSEENLAESYRPSVAKQLIPL